MNTSNRLLSRIDEAAAALDCARSEAAALRSEVISERTIGTIYSSTSKGPMSISRMNTIHLINAVRRLRRTIVPAARQRALNGMLVELGNRVVDGGGENG